MGHGVRVEDEVGLDTCECRELSLEMSIVVSLRREDNDLWQYSRDREETMDSQRETNMLVTICLNIEEKGGSGPGG